MEFYDKFMDRFQDISEVKNPAIRRQRSSNNLEPSKANVLGEYDAVTFTVLYLKVIHDMVFQNS